MKTLDKIADVLIPSAQAAEANPLASMSDEELKAAYAASAGAQGAPQSGASSAAPAAAERSAAQSIAHGFGVGARGLAVGASELPGMVTDAVTGPINAALDYYHDNRAPTMAELVTGKQKGFRFQRVGAATDGLLTQAGMPQAESGVERVAQDASRGAAGAVGGVGAGKFVAALASGPLGRAVGQMFSSGAGLQAASGATAGAAAGTTREMGGGEGAQMAAALGAGLVPGGGQALAQMGVRRALIGGEPARQAAAENLAMFKDAGIDPTLAQVTRGRIAQAAESTLAKTPGSAGVMAKVGERQAEQMAASVRDLADSLAPGADAMQAGEAIQKGINGFKSGMQQVQVRLYSELDKHIPSAAPIPATRTQEALKELNADIDGAPALSQWFKNARIKGIDAAMSSDIEQATVPGALPYQAIKKLRTLVGRELTDSTLMSDVPRSKWSALYGALTEDLGDAAKAAGPEAAERWQWANTFTKTQLGRLEELSGIVGRDAPEKIFAAATSGTANGNTVIDRVVSAIPKQSRREVAAALLQRMGRASAAHQNAEGDAFSSERFLTTLSSMSPAARKTIFGRLGDPGIEERVEQLAKIAQTRREDGKVFANPSGTAGATASIAAGGGIAGGLVSFAMTGNASPLLGAVAVPAGAGFASRYVTNAKKVRDLVAPFEARPGALPSVAMAAGRAAAPATQAPGEGDAAARDFRSMSDDELRAAYIAAGGKFPDPEPPMTGPDASTPPAETVPTAGADVPRIEIRGVGPASENSVASEPSASLAPIVPAEVKSREPVATVEVPPTDAAASEPAGTPTAPPAGRVKVSKAVYDAIQQAHAAQWLPPALIEVEGEPRTEQAAAAAPDAPVALAASQGLAAAGARADADASPAVAQAPAEPEILRNRQGKPFTVRVAAMRAAAQAGDGFGVEPAEGGFIVVRRTSADGAAPAEPAMAEAPSPETIRNRLGAPFTNRQAAMRAAQGGGEGFAVEPEGAGFVAVKRAPAAAGDSVVEEPAAVAAAAPSPLQRPIERRLAARGVQQGDLLNARNRPFTVKIAAMRAAQKAGDGLEVAAVDGGYVVRRADGAAGERAAPASSTVAVLREPRPAPTVLAGAEDAIDQAAHEAATSPSNDRPEPSDAQREAGNFKKGHIRIAGLDISVENPKGSVRRGTSQDGTEWERGMKAHYGYIKRTEGSDGEQVDVYVGPRRDAPKVYVVDQVRADGSFDEHKALLGYTSLAAARSAYAEHYPKGFKIGNVTTMPVDEFKAWLLNGDLTKAASEARA